MTKIVNDPKSCIFSSYLRCWPLAGSAWPRSDQDDRFAWVPAGVRWTSRRFFAATAVGVEFVDEMFAATSPARATPTSSAAAPARLMPDKHAGRARAGVRAAPLADRGLHRRSSRSARAG